MAAAAPWVFYDASAKKTFFDCPLCCGPLKPPVLQCRNAHAACSGCAASRSNKCASCDGVYEHIHWLDAYHLAAKVRCPNEAYGCRSWVPYCMPDDHQLVCIFRDQLASQHADKDVLQSSMLEDEVRSCAKPSEDAAMEVGGRCLHVPSDTPPAAEGIVLQVRIDKLEGDVGINPASSC